MNLTLPWVVLLVCTAAGACGSKSDDPRAGVDAGAVCSPFGGECPVGTTCDFVGSCGTGLPTWSCRSLGGPAPAAGEGCGLGKACPDRTSCLAGVDAPASCVSFCRDDADCPPGRGCEHRDISAVCALGRATFSVGVCLRRLPDGGTSG